ncbi:MAG: hypothetical protein PSX81_14520 [bacterium]|nr:hypothetical protein [bacterium]
MKIGDLPQKKWFSWSLVMLLVLANVISYQMSNQYFKQVNPSTTEEVLTGANYLGSGNKIIDWARDILRFFKNP